MQIKYILVVLVIHSISISTTIHITSGNQNYYNDLQNNDQTLHYTDFSQLRQYNDISYVESIKTNNSITFTNIPTNDTSDWHSENYVLLISDFGVGSDFTISFDLDLNFSTRFSSFALSLGHYVGRSYPSDFNLKITNDHSFCRSRCSATDNDGEYSYHFFDDDLYSGDSLTFTIERNDDYVVMTIEEESRGIILHQSYGPNFGQEIHYLMISFDPNSIILNDFGYKLIVTNPEINIEVSGEPIKNNPFFSTNWLSILLIVGFSVVLLSVVIAVIIGQRRREIKHIREDPTLYNRREPLSEDFLESVVPPEMSEAIAKKVQTTVGDKFIPHPKIFDGSHEDSTCMVCRTSVKKGDEIFQCPFCKHVFHKDHFIKWVSTKHKCPICKEVLIKEQETRK